MGPAEIHLHVLRELADEVAKLLYISKRSWQFCDVPTDWKRENVTSPPFQEGGGGRSRELQASQSHLCAWKDQGADPPEGPTEAHIYNEACTSSEVTIRFQLKS